MVEHDGLVYGHSWRVARNVPTERGTAQFEIMAPSTYAGKHFHACEPCRNVLRAFAVIFVAVDEERTSDEIVAQHVAGGKA